MDGVGNPLVDDDDFEVHCAGCLEGSMRNTSTGLYFIKFGIGASISDPLVDRVEGGNRVRFLAIIENKSRPPCKVFLAVGETLALACFLVFSRQF